MNDTIRTAFEAWAKQEFSEYFEDDGESMFDRANSNNYNNLLLRNALAPFQAGASWQAARAQPIEPTIESHLDSVTVGKMHTLAAQGMKPVGIVMLADATGMRATIDMGRVTWARQNPEPQIDGYPLWSGLPPPVERGVLSDAEILERLSKSFHPSNEPGNSLLERVYPPDLVPAVRAILSAQADATKRNRLPLSDEDKAAFHKAAEARDQAVELPSGALMFINYGEGPQDYSDLNCPHCGGSGHKGDIGDTQSTDAGNVSKSQHEINMEGLMSQRMILCDTCGNKRCPHANDPDNYACTGSNEPGQVGSAYPAVTWDLEPHPPSRHCMCEECKPSFESDCLGTPTTQPLIAEAARDDRARGRAEALAIILTLEAENGFDDYLVWSECGDSGDSSASWSEEKLRELLHVDSELADMMDKAEAEYWHNLGLREEAEREAVKRDDVAGDAKQLERQLEVCGYELQRERFKAEHFFKILMGIFNLLNPELVKLEDGKIMRFNNPYASETLDALSKRIRAIKDDLDAAIAASAKGAQ